MGLDFPTLQIKTLSAGCSHNEFRWNWFTCFPQAVQLTFFWRASSAILKKVSLIFFLHITTKPSPKTKCYSRSKLNFWLVHITWKFLFEIHSKLHGTFIFISSGSHDQSTWELEPLWSMLRSLNAFPKRTLLPFNCLPLDLLLVLPSDGLSDVAPSLSLSAEGADSFSSVCFATEVGFLRSKQKMFTLKCRNLHNYSTATTMPKISLFWAF